MIISNNNNLEFNGKNTNSQTSGFGINSQSYSNIFLKYSNYSDVSNGCIQISTDDYSNTSDGNWNIEYPIIDISNNNNNLLNEAFFLSTIKFDNIGGGNDETFYYEIYNGTSWVELATFSSNIENIQYIITPHVVSNGGVIKMRARVAGFQKKDYLNIGSFAIEYIYA